METGRPPSPDEEQENLLVGEGCGEGVWLGRKGGVGREGVW